MSDAGLFHALWLPWLHVLNRNTESVNCRLQVCSSIQLRQATNKQLEFLTHLNHITLVEGAAEDLTDEWG